MVGGGKPAGSALACIQKIRLGDGTIDIDLDPAKTAEALGLPSDNLAPEFLSFRRTFSQRRRGVETRALGALALHPHTDLHR